MRIPAEKMKARVQEYITSTRTRIELSCLQFPISKVLMRVARGKKSVIYIYMYDIYDEDGGGGGGGDDDDGGDDDLRWVKVRVRVRVVNLLNMPETMQSPISEVNP